MDPEQWWRCLEINVRGPFLCARAVLPGMIARGQGRIINVASGKGASPVPYLGAYVTSKAALIRFTENLALECREHGIRVFAIHPGTVRTAMVTEVIDSPAGRQWLPWFRDAVEQGQYVMPECAAQLVLQLASGRADALSGRFLRIDQDLDTLIARAEEIAATDLHRLRVREAARGVMRPSHLRDRRVLPSHGRSPRTSAVWAPVWETRTPCWRA
jgi:NAD(P)-dependent dehydrogenase (short-subunit alcohol dehydrogenase family)